jgi:cytochrome c553
VRDVTAVVLLAVLAAAQAPTSIPEMWTAWCARCHAEDGSGKVNEPTITVEPMDFTECKVAAAEPDADWERAIAKGGPGVGLSPQMPAFEDSLSGDQIRAFVSHMRLILPAVSHWDESPAPSITEASLVALYERRVGRRSMIEIAVPLVGTNSLSTWTSGLGDVAVAFKHAIYDRADTPRIVSLGLETVLPSGDRFEDHGSGTTIFEPYLSAGTLLRDWYLQSQFKVELPANRARADRAVAYNAYIGRDASGAPDTWTFGVELNGEVAFPYLGVTTHLVAVTPQVRKGLTGTGALAASAGVMLPLNKRDAQGVRWVGYLLWEYLEPWRARQ